ncbi:MAG TPA: orotidine-5'-phosphate decarboxylase [Sulfurovum sp.]|jgi:orotidine-5'-phosphate decarboxylase|nr:MAG: orotidine 5'-phosphate decarboxylase [Sulfurovum sp. 35-42-20]OYY55493.1 MAG: orotidine 5'-phosphate decarboxylase [Sulfurovum sp. 28-43-6]OYZ26575.1 MAG: orotidine 5'-phosphate decarboxylase [Sulfurovum sp. 16-42-52]OYZ50662.1 MAG: orotidine 5'-phosphate decarboxylase [Sulfurovum sp. 24-42-9]OZA47142.1 MAG: orotidine 5'-phosphate decarboxylase [Sulfurovum sp. 17-42-90]OZA59045.1 MAG: orotidine 5'-phosphate decarboxylase [Sulfurovum sp. 39-42-12]HQR73453.1 orotidine-5'-phosphate decar
MELCVALDLPSSEENLALARLLQPYNLWMKVGFRTYIRDGKPFIEALKALNPEFKIFLDLKLYDIPNTMADAAEEIAKLGVDMFNIHASAGEVAMQTVMQRLANYEKRPLVLAVTALTSFDETHFQAVYEKSIAQKAEQFAKMSYANGLDGVVCSAHESRAIKNVTSQTFLTLCPGIRPFGEDAGDQQRVATLELAQQEGVDFPVVGRPIYKADNPQKKVEEILNVMATF